MSNPVEDNKRLSGHDSPINETKYIELSKTLSGIYSITSNGIKYVNVRHKPENSTAEENSYLDELCNSIIKRLDMQKVKGNEEKFFNNFIKVLDQDFNQPSREVVIVA